MTVVALTAGVVGELGLASAELELELVEQAETVAVAQRNVVTERAGGIIVGADGVDVVSVEVGLRVEDQLTGVELCLAALVAELESAARLSLNVYSAIGVTLNE